jgi:branched-chain amino acid transport system ATP-binding protein
MLEISGLTKRFGGLIATNDVTLNFAAGTLSAVIGPNGAGKSTFFNLISGAIVPDAGRILFKGEDITGLNRAAIVRKGIGRAFQVASFFPTMTVAENLQAAIAAHRGQWADLGRSFPRQGVRERALEVAEMLGLQDSADRLSANLSHGDQKLLDIALALALEPSLLLLDEPTAGMGPEERWRMIEKVQRLWQVQNLTLVFIEHDMDIVFGVASSIRVLCYGRVLAEGTPDEIRNNPAVIEAYLGTPEAEEEE